MHHSRLFIMKHIEIWKMRNEERNILKQRKEKQRYDIC